MRAFDQVIKRPALTIAVAVGIAALSAPGVFRLLSNQEVHSAPSIVLSVIYPGANAVDVEQRLMRPIEARLGALRGISTIESSCRSGVGTMTISFERGSSLAADTAAVVGVASAVADPLGARIAGTSAIPLAAMPEPAESMVHYSGAAAISAVLALAIILVMTRSRAAIGVVIASVVVSGFAALGAAGALNRDLRDGAAVGTLLAILLTVDAALRTREAFGRSRALGRTRRAAARAAAAEIGRGIVTILVCSIALFAAFATTESNEFRWVTSAATIAIVTEIAIALVAIPMVIVMSSVWPGNDRGTRRRSTIGQMLYAFDCRLDRVADRYHEALAWTIDRRGTASGLAIACLVIAVVHRSSAGSIAAPVDLTAPTADSPPISLSVLGPDWRTLSGVSQRLAEELGKAPDVRNVRVSTKPRGLNWTIGGSPLGNDPAMASTHGSPESDVVESNQPVQIDHLDGERVVRVDADVASSAANVIESVEARVASVPLPPQYRVVVGGTLVENVAAVRRVTRRLGVVALVVAFALSWHFRSMANGVTSVLVASISALGSTVTVAAVNAHMDIAALFGICIALGLVLAHATAAIDYAADHRARGVTMRVLAIEAARIRFRPLLVTTLIAFAVVLPIGIVAPASHGLLSLGAAVLGGIVIGSLAILFVLPALCGVVADAATRARREPSLAA